ncbi:hypothetical protein [Arthrobacter bambusae]|uniref:hypothetical protein n=1 Tax=Arthrobacter bambusae TaxID=1338426 RepID=UPI0027D7A8A3|nr:hypothetical protein [Arthrobacter bambusae]
MFIVIVVALFAAGAPFPIFVAFFCVVLALDVALAVTWARRDSLAAYRLTVREP